MTIQPMMPSPNMTISLVSRSPVSHTLPTTLVVGRVREYRNLAAHRAGSPTDGTTTVPPAVVRLAHALFDHPSSCNAKKPPLDAIANLAPHIRQAHIMGGRKVGKGAGWGQLGLPQGSDEDELPGNRMLYELLMLGEATPQVICFALEQEVGYYAPPFRLDGEESDPIIQFREPSQTPLDTSRPLERILLYERRWASQQVVCNRTTVAVLREICAAALVEADIIAR